MDGGEARAVGVEVVVVYGVVVECRADFCFDGGEQVWVAEDEAEHPGA